MRLAACLVLACTLVAAEGEPRPATWATPVECPAMHNLFQVAPNLYRSAQPDEAGMKAIECLGVKRVIELRNFHDDREAIRGTALVADDVGLNTWALEDADVIKVLRILKDPANGPFLIHCKHGSDRTGTMCAMYRLVVQGWTKEDAIAEMTKGGYGYWSGWTNLVRYVKEVDVDRIKKAVDAP